MVVLVVVGGGGKGADGPGDAVIQAAASFVFR